MYGAILGFVMMGSLGQVSPGWWRLTPPVEFHWNQSGLSSDKETKALLHQAVVLATLDACVSAVGKLRRVEKRLGSATGEVWMHLGRAFARCMHWQDAYRAVRRSGLAISRWPAWAKVAAGLTFLAHGRPWDALQLWKRMLLRSSGMTAATRILAALAALEAGEPGQAMDLLAPVFVAGKSGGDVEVVVLGWLMRGLALLLDGQALRARSFFQAVVRAGHGLDAVGTARPLFVGCFDADVVGALLQQAMGCDVGDRLRARAALYRSRSSGRGFAGGPARSLPGSLSRTRAAVRGRRCAGLVQALEEAGRWPSKSSGQVLCRRLSKRFRQWTRSRP